MEVARQHDNKIAPQQDQSSTELADARSSAEPTTSKLNTDYWALVRPLNIDVHERDLMCSHKLTLGDVFSTRGKTWLHCGWYSAVYHTVGLATDGERQVIAHVERVMLLRNSSTEEQEALKEAIITNRQLSEGSS
jgi:hypothetical protein